MFKVWKIIPTTQNRTLRVSRVQSNSQTSLEVEGSYSKKRSKNSIN